MAKLAIKPGSTSVTVEVFIQDSSVTTGAGLTGLAYNTASLTAYYKRNGNVAPVAITLATLAAITTAWSSGGFIAADGTNTPGLYRLDIPDAALATGARSVIIYLKGATNMAPCLLEIDLTNDANLVNILGTAVSTPATAGVLDVNIKKLNNTTLNGNGSSTPWGP